MTLLDCPYLRLQCCPLRRTLKSLTWHLAWNSLCQYICLLFPCALHFSLREQILRQAVWCSKQKGLESFAPTTQTQDPPFKGKHKLARDALFTPDTNRGCVFPKNVAKSLHVMQPAWNLTAFARWDEDNFAEGERLIVAHFLPFVALESYYSCFVLSNGARD